MPKKKFNLEGKTTEEIDVLSANTKDKQIPDLLSAIDTEIERLDVRAQQIRTEKAAATEGLAK